MTLWWIGGTFGAAVAAVASLVVVWTRERAARRRAELSLRKLREEVDQTAMQGTTELLETSTRQMEEYAKSIAELERQVVERTFQLERTNRELEAFAYSVSHDLRAPLERVNDFSRAMEEDCAEQLDALALDYLKRIRASTRRMGELIDDLLKLSRLTGQEMHRSQVDLSRIAREVADGLLTSDPARQVTFSISSGLTAEGDTSLLRIVLENLLGNAWKFTSKRTDGRIEFGMLKLAGTGDTVQDATVAFYVRDNGVGFDMRYADKLFGAFQRIHRESDFPGTGIGLATVQRIIHRHGGRVWAQAVPGEGATFYFTV